MLGWFKSKEEGATVNDQIWMSTHAKLNTCLRILQSNPSILFVAWFKETEERMREFLGSNYSPACLINAAQLTTEQLRGRLVIFLEHYPLREKVQLLFKQLSLSNIPVLSALDEPFFTLFGGEGIHELMKKLGTSDDEVIAHSMILKSIQRAQEKIAEKVQIEKTSDSAQQWLVINKVILFR
jgi:hypothetical protein